MYMVQAMIDIKKKTNQVINIVKAKYGLKDKSEAIDLIAVQYEEFVMEPELRPEFVERMKRVHKEEAITVDDFSERYGLKENVQTKN